VIANLRYPGNSPLDISPTIPYHAHMHISATTDTDQQTATYLKRGRKPSTSPQDDLEIRALWEAGKSPTWIAKQYNITTSALQRRAQRGSWVRGKRDDPNAPPDIAHSDLVHMAAERLTRVILDDHRKLTADLRRAIDAALRSPEDSAGKGGLARGLADMAQALERLVMLERRIHGVEREVPAMVGVIVVPAKSTNDEWMRIAARDAVTVVNTGT